jgi:hypothetical protein
MVVFTLFFTVFIVASCFWGRMILRAVGIKDESDYGNPNVLVAFLAILVLISRYTVLFSNRLDILFYIVFFGAIVGFIIETVLFIRNNKRSLEIKAIIQCHKVLFVGIFICLIMSLCFSFISFSGKLDPWLSRNMDYYLWILMSDYWIGAFDPANYAIVDFNESIRDLDAFGSDVLFAYFATITFKTSFMASTGYLIVLFSSIGTVIYLLVSKVFKFKFLVSFLISLFFVFSNFIIYLGFSGYFPHLIGLFSYLVCIFVVLTDQSDDAKQYFFKLLFPILLLYISYQAAFLIFIFISLCFIVVNCFIKNWIFQNGIKTIFTWLKKVIIPFLIAILVSIIIVPQMFLTLITRSIESVNQEAGYGLMLLKPLLFSGIPFIDNSLRLRYSDASIITYFVWILVLVFLFVFNMRFLKGNNDTRQQKDQIKTLFYMYLFSVAGYLLCFSILSDIYQVWKLAAYIILPLSFLPISLLFFSLQNISKPVNHLFRILVTFIAIVIIVPVVVVNVLYNQQRKVQPFFFVSPLPLYSKILELDKLDSRIDKIVFDLYSPIQNQIAAIASESWNRKIYFRKAFYILPSSYDFFPSLDINTIFVSNLKYEGIYGGNFVFDPQYTEIDTYSYDDVVKKGMLISTTIDDYTGFVPFENITLDFLVPEHLYNSDIVLKIDFNKKGLIHPSCNKAIAFINNNQEAQPWQLDLESFEFPIKVESRTHNMVKVVINFPEFGKRIDETSSNNQNLCFYQIEKVDLISQ